MHMERMKRSDPFEVFRKFNEVEVVYVERERARERDLAINTLDI